MIRPDGAYELTRRRGEQVTVTRVTSTAPNPLSGLKNATTVDTIVRWAVHMPTEYSRIFRAEATQQRIGASQFIMWTGDLDFTSLTQDDYITIGDDRYEVISSVIEDTAFIVTANQVKRSPVYITRGIVQQPITQRLSLKADSTSFKAKWKTDNAGTSSSTQITLPTHSGGTYNFTVHWGDGTSDEITTWDDPALTHTYPSAGLWDTTIYGANVGDFVFNDGGDKLKLLLIYRWGGFALGETPSMFKGCANLECTATDAPTIAGHMREAFMSCTKFNARIGHWDLSAIGSGVSANKGEMTRTFQGCNNLPDQDLGAWDVSGVTLLWSTFRSVSNFTGQGLSKWNTSSFTSLFEAFHSTKIVEDISDWDVSGVSLFSSMFANTDFNHPIGKWDMTAMTNLIGMFAGNPTFDQDISSWDISGLVDVTNFMGFGIGERNTVKGKLSTPNYDALLIGWEGQAVIPSGLSVDFGLSQYTNSGAALAARNALIAGPNNWTILDGGQFVP